MTHIKDYDVTVSLLKNFTGLPDGNQTVAYYMPSKYPYSGLLVNAMKSTLDKYVMYGRSSNVLYVSLILNSIAGKSQFTDSFGNPLPINTRSVSKVIFPPEINVDGFTYGTVLESYIQGVYSIKENNHAKKLDDKDLQSLQMFQSFLTLVRNYYVEQLYLPDFFKSKGIDIIKPWSELVSKTSVECENRILGFTKNLIKSLGSEDNTMMEALNKMKFYYLEVINQLKESLRVTVS